ncbi:hypothetical protein Taro_019425, partial [Colocasia esculenta]|nr:hypothetical protein [Colocasia esculenta]
ARERRARPAAWERARGRQGESARPAVLYPLCSLLLPRARRDEASVGRGEGVRAALGHEVGRSGCAAGDLLPLSASSAGEAGRGEGGARRGRPGCVGARGRRERVRGRWSSAPVCFFRGWGGTRRGGARGRRERARRRRSSALVCFFRGQGWSGAGGEGGAVIACSPLRWRGWGKLAGFCEL